MYTQAVTHKKSPALLRYLLSVLLPLAVGLGLFLLLMHPPLKEFTLMLVLMGVTSLISALATYLAYRLGWIYRSPHIRWTLIGGYLLAGALVFFNVWVTARMMFASQHDLLLATVLLVFASGIAVTVGYFLTEALNDRIIQIGQAARKIQNGDLAARVPVKGQDEMTSLAQTFNEMAVQLEVVEQKKRELDTLQRDLIAWVSHDLRTPLTSIRAILEALGDGLVEDPQTTRRYLETAQRDIRTLSNLINDLFEISQMEAGGLRLDCQPNAMSDLISDTIESFSQISVRQGVQLSGSVDPGLDSVVMDAPRIGRVLDNLVSNALRHTPPGGSIVINAKKLISLVEVAVRDTGEGIGQEDLPFVFERFYRGEKSRNRATGGSGLGLAIARGIILAHGGTIQVESKPGQGAVFTFTLPLTSKSTNSHPTGENAAG